MRPRPLRALRPEPLFYKCWCATVCILLAAGASAYECKDASVQPTAEGAVVVSAVAWGGASDALLALATSALRARGVPAAPAPTPPECGADAAARACQEALLRALACGDVHAALLPVAAARPPDAVRMRDHFLEEFGDAAPPARLACWALGGARAARSLLDLADEDTAALYDVTLESLLPNCTDTRQRPNNDQHSKLCSESNTTSYEYNSELCVVGASCGMLLTRTAGEARTLGVVAREWRLRVRVRVAASGALFSAAALLCSRTPPDAPDRYLPLGPPPCATGRDCAFDSYRLVKIGNALKLAYSPSAISVLSRLSLQEEELRELERNATLSGAEAAAAETLARHPSWAGPGREVRVAVMVPATTPREAYDARALHAAAALAETASPRGSLRYKVEMLDDRCSATQAFKYLTDARGSEWGALAGVAGPACGAPFADVARQGAALALPLLAYTAQAPPPGEARALALLAAGDARLQATAWAAWLAQSGWRRAAVLSELATRAALDVADLGVDVLVHVELPADQDDAHLIFEQVSKWVSRVVAVNGRVLYVAAEDARVVRAALCAGGAAGLSPGAGAVWLLPALAPAALRPAPSDAHNCTHERLLELADGHFSLAPAWLADWNATAPERRDWADMWREACRRLRDAPDCDAPSPHAALLYDVLRLWDATVRRLLAVRPAALDDFHHVDIVRSLLEDATAAPYEGVTGTFAWTSIGGVRARSSPLVLSQWQGGVARRVATWAGALAPGPAAPRWLTADGAVPDDGGERCGLQALADALGADCRTAFVALGASLLAVLVAALAAAAWQCKRRAERKYRRRLAALGLTRLGPKPGGLDRWEIPRTRVVINRKLGTGAFGTVYGGHALLGEDRGWTAVAVKTLKPGASTEEKLDFLSEAEAMKRFDHKNVVRLLAVVTKTEPVCTVMEFMLYGDLKNYLLARRHLSDGEEVSALRLTGMALDAARALSYLAQLRYVHRDVAARNCLVSAHRVVKLADFGMTRLVFENDYYRFSRKGMLPVRWMAPESLGLGVFSPASDVWSFGVLLYEIVTFGSLPFQGLSNAEVLARVKAGHTLELPAGLKPQLEGLIKSCWQQEYKARPCAAEIAAFLADSPRLLTPCLDVPLDALPLDDSDAPWRLATDRAEARWVSWGAPPSAATDTTYLSTDAPPQDTDAFLP